jgi:CRP/FNR family transcriptional regulator, cyclic AMP receptor protein
MDDALTLSAERPERTVAAGETLITDGAPGTALYVLVEGGFEVRRHGQRLTTVSEPGAFLGEIAALLGTSYGADVVALERSTVRVIDDPATAIADDPHLALAIARLLARRLRAVTTYLGDLKEQYAGSGGHLALMDQVLSELTALGPAAVEPGSEREDVPDY